MYKVTVNELHHFSIAQHGNEFTVNNQSVLADTVEISKNRYQVLYNHKSFLVDIIELKKDEKRCSIRINGNSYNLKIHDRFDELLHQLGMDNLNTTKISEIKAPMPGMVLSVLVKEGELVKKGDNLFILEAMKMENIIKSPGDALIKAIKIKAGDKVEKNQILAAFG